MLCGLEQREIMSCLTHRHHLESSESELETNSSIYVSEGVSGHQDGVWKEEQVTLGRGLKAQLAGSLAKK